MISFLYPSDCLNPKKVDECYIDEYLNLKNKGFNLYIINPFDLEQPNIFPAISKDSKLLYRGWMLNSEQYKQLYFHTNEQLIVSPEMYLSSHHLPLWYNEVTNFTPQSIVTDLDNIIDDYKKMSQKNVFIKDYVKSLKTGKGSIAHSENDILDIVQQMKHYKGNIEGGLILREEKEFISDSEQRFFVLNNQIHCPENTSITRFELVSTIVEQLKKDRFFYSIDIISDTQGKDWLVEIGDGQVSDSVGWTIDSFCTIFDYLQKKNNFKMSK